MAVKALSGGVALEARLREIAQKISKATTVQVGFLEGATYPDGTSVPMVAAIQEFGSPEKHIPPRPFFRRMIAEQSPGWGDTISKVVKGADYDTAVALGRMGEVIKGQLQQSIVNLTDPALMPATVAAKGSSKPLVDTGHMLNSVDYEVEQ
jgi:hypothetical protein